MMIATTVDSEITVLRSILGAGPDGDVLEAAREMVARVDRYARELTDARAAIGAAPGESLADAIQGSLVLDLVSELAAIRRVLPPADGLSLVAQVQRLVQADADYRSLITGISRNSTELIDNAGITVRAGDDDAERTLDAIAAALPPAEGLSLVARVQRLAQASADFDAVAADYRAELDEFRTLLGVGKHASVTYTLQVIRAIVGAEPSEDLLDAIAAALETRASPDLLAGVRAYDDALEAADALCAVLGASGVDADLIGEVKQRAADAAAQIWLRRVRPALRGEG